VNKKGESKMNARNRIARSVGAFFLFSNVTFILGAFGFVEPILGAPDYLTLASANRAQVIFGALLELANGIAYLGIGVLMFSVLRRRFRGMALLYVGFRIIEFVMQTLSDLSPLALVTLSEEFVRAGAAEASTFQAAGTLLLAQRYWAFQMVSITLALGALLLYTMLYRSKLIPRFISVWGLVGAITVLTTTMLDIFALSVGPAIGLVLGLPMLLNELFLGVWLIAKGFSESAILSKPAEPQ
jgi:hypothetical protein